MEVYHISNLPPTTMFPTEADMPDNVNQRSWQSPVVHEALVYILFLLMTIFIDRTLAHNTEDPASNLEPSRGRNESDFGSSCRDNLFIWLQGSSATIFSLPSPLFLFRNIWFLIEPPAPLVTLVTGSSLPLRALSLLVVQTRNLHDISEIYEQSRTGTLDLRCVVRVLS
jgi:hypothetical protein